jgi:RNA polymerase sigma factor (sigma-70 family)
MRSSSTAGSWLARMNRRHEGRTVNSIDVEAWYRRYGPMVLRRCRSLLNDEDQALDAMQEVFVKVLRRKDTLRPDYPSSLLYRIATNTCLNAIKSRKRRQGGGGEQGLENLPGRDDPAGRTLDSCFLEQLFEAAKPGTRFIAETHYLRDATLEETAQEAGLSVSGVRKRLFSLHMRALQLSA